MRLQAALLCLVLVLPVTAEFYDWSPTVGVKLTTPQKLSVTLGISNTHWGGLFGGDSGFLFKLEPGLSGGKVHLGMRSAFSIMFIPITSLDICGVYMYTWNDPWGGLENDQSYLGVEIQGNMYLMIASAGIYRHIAGGDDQHDFVFSAGVGLGF